MSTEAVTREELVLLIGKYMWQGLAPQVTLADAILRAYPGLCYEKKEPRWAVRWHLDFAEWVVLRSGIRDASFVRESDARACCMRIVFAMAAREGQTWYITSKSSGPRVVLRFAVRSGCSGTCVRPCAALRLYRFITYPPCALCVRIDLPSVTEAVPTA